MEKTIIVFGDTVIIKSNFINIKDRPFSIKNIDIIK